MMLFLFMALSVWVTGMLMQVPTRQRWIMIGILAIVLAALTVILPVGHPLREAAGGDVRFWLMLLGFAAVFLGYRALLKRVRQRANETHVDSGDLAPNSAPEDAADTALARKTGHIMLREIGGAGQNQIEAARVLVIGAGGLGAPALMYLGAAGVGEIGIVDDDVVDASNLQRQVIFTEADIGRPKVAAAAERLQAQNPALSIRTYQARAGEGAYGAALFADYDLILDGTDTDAARYAINKAAIEAGKPLLSGAIAQWDGQISLYDPAHGAPCYRCVFPKAAAEGVAPSCAAGGVLAPLPGVIGTMMAVEALKWITGAGEPLIGRVMLYDGLTGAARVMKVSRNRECPDCGHVATAAKAES